MDKQIVKMYLRDVYITSFFLGALWLIFGYVLFSIRLILSDPYIKTLILGIGILAGSYASVTLLAVMNHLKKHRGELYSEELKYNKNI